MAYETQKIEIVASAWNCYDVICNFQDYPKWQKNIESVTVLDRENGKICVVEFQVNAVMKMIQYTLHYTYEENPQKDQWKLLWTYVGGDVKNLEGNYIFEGSSTGKTLVTYSLELELGFKVPQGMLSRMKTSAMQQILESLRKKIETEK